MLVLRAISTSDLQNRTQGANVHMHTNNVLNSAYNIAICA